MSLQKYCAEFLGTFLLTFLVALSLVWQLPLPTPVIAALVVGTCVYTIGGISGAHLNPAVSVALLVISKVSVADAAAYIAVQFLGAGLARWSLAWLVGAAPSLAVTTSARVGIGEAMGAFILLFGIAAVVLKNVHAAAAGIVIGASLLLGLMSASPLSNAILNPAVALGIGSLSLLYVLGPLAGGIAGVVASLLLHWQPAARPVAASSAQAPTI